MGASADAETGSREPDPSFTGSGPSGFDPARWSPFTYAHGYPDVFYPNVTIWRFGTNGREINGSKPTKVTRLYSADQVSEIVAAAIATEARRAETVQQGSVHEGAGPQDIAQNGSGGVK